VTEAEWLACSDPDAMLEFLAKNRGISERRLRLFGIACCHSANVPDEKLIAVAQRFADEKAGGEDLNARTRCSPDSPLETQHVLKALAGIDWDLELYAGQPALAASQVAWDAAWACTENRVTSCKVLGLAEACAESKRKQLFQKIREEQAVLLRDIFVNPFVVSPALDPDYLNREVLGLARRIYEEQAFEHMPELAAALQNAACDNEDVLNHCREQDRPHVRGCWLLDMVLGKQ
jgi:hypothetical protein